MLTGCVLFAAIAAYGEPVAARHTEGLVHGFLTLRTLDGVQLATGDLLQVAHGDRVTTRLVFHFKDRSLHDETVEDRQRQDFEFQKDHLVQKGPAFPQPLDMSIDGASGQVTVRYTNEKGESKVESERLTLPADLANGMLLTLLKNVDPDALPKAVSYVAATPKPRLVKLDISNAGEEPFSIAGSGQKATHYVLKMTIGGLAGLIAPLVGEQPPDSHVWILGGDTPAFVKAEQVLYLGGPVVRIELASPAWPKTATTSRQ